MEKEGKVTVVKCVYCKKDVSIDKEVPLSACLECGTIYKQDGDKVYWWSFKKKHGGTIVLEA